MGSVVTWVDDASAPGVEVDLKRVAVGVPEEARRVPLVRRRIVQSRLRELQDRHLHRLDEGLRNNKRREHVHRRTLETLFRGNPGRNA